MLVSRKQRSWTIAGLMIAAAQPAQAHHSFAMFDQKKTITVDGVLTKFVWTNPHVFIAVDAPGSGGKTERYAIEAASTNMLARKGWKVGSLKGGERIGVTFNPLKKGCRGVLVILVQGRDGTVLKQ